MRIRVAAFAAFVLPLLFSCGNTIQSRLSVDPEAKKAWTVLYYADADNSLDNYIMLDMAEIKAGLSKDADINVILLVDRASDASATAAFGESFTDTRLYRLLDGAFVRLDGGSQFPSITVASDNYEANMGDATTLKKFVDYGKEHYPASHYALFMSDHGGGARGVGASSAIITKEVCIDESSTDSYGFSDALYTAEITDTLTSAESVDLLVFDACFMGTAEIAYQYRNTKTDGSFSADFMAASAPSVWGYGLPYTAIFQRLQPLSGDNGTTDTILTASNGTTTNEMYYDPATMTAEEFGEAIVEEQYDSTSADSANGNAQAFALYDLSKIATVKTALDAAASGLSKSTMESARTASYSTNSFDYMGTSGSNSQTYDWTYFPYFDLYDIASTAGLSTIAADVDACVVYSFGNSSFGNFVPNTSGLAIFFPEGSTKNYYASPEKWTDWYVQQWYTSAAISGTVFYLSYNGSTYVLPGYGKLDWCIYAGNDSTTCNASGTGTVENWFELLDSWYDTSNTSSGGLNGVQY